VTHAHRPAIADLIVSIAHDLARVRVGRRRIHSPTFSLSHYHPTSDANMLRMHDADRRSTLQKAATRARSLRDGHDRRPHFSLPKRTAAAAAAATATKRNECRFGRLQFYATTFAFTFRRRRSSSAVPNTANDVEAVSIRLAVPDGARMGAVQKTAGTTSQSFAACLVVFISSKLADRRRPT
jgi:hypothetical protein